MKKTDMQNTFVVARIDGLVGIFDIVKRHLVMVVAIVSQNSSGKNSADYGSCELLHGVVSA